MFVTLKYIINQGGCIIIADKQHFKQWMCINDWEKNVDFLYYMMYYKCKDVIQF